MRKDPFWDADLARYATKRPFLKEQSIWAIWIYRFGRRVDYRKNGVIKKLQTEVYWVLFRIVETLTTISIPKSALIGPGLRIWHFGGIFIHSNTIIGSNCTLRQGVTIGNRGEDQLAPVIGDNVDIGAYAQILGDIRIGNNCKIGAMSVVLQNVPDNATAVGIPAKILFK
ncbi:Serine acetyltransferase [Candidatus Methylobacter favarea]|uniref:Serine acetyltransferase n=1 Tax=Candidatus Methylobacter favarea TaxID=2707345 RepID=A0A8S0WS73_9GAMM|nr:serine acetyltransferase [Candidatus Methylobacter favarea]CAA9892531.1 Serine acetyltransferase [Candidatus Methylobacter favarea]